MSDDKIFKNPKRNDPVVYTPYIPQYQLRGLEPEQHISKPSLSMKQAVGSTDNPRLPRAAIRQPYAEIVISKEMGTVPNVGNNMEHSWSGVDNDLVNDLPDILDKNQPMIDNNEFITIEAANSTLLSDEVSNNRFVKSDEIQNALRSDLRSNELFEFIDKLEEEVNYLILVEGLPVASGNLEEIQDQTTALVFGEHPSYLGKYVSTDDIIVIKKVKIKVGVFLE